MPNFQNSQPVVVFLRCCFVKLMKSRKVEADQRLTSRAQVPAASCMTGTDETADLVLTKHRNRLSPRFLSAGWQKPDCNVCSYFCSNTQECHPAGKATTRNFFCFCLYSVKTVGRRKIGNHSRYSIPQRELRRLQGSQSSG